MIRLFPTTIRWLITALREYQRQLPDPLDMLAVHNNYMRALEDNNNITEEDKQISIPLESGLENGQVAHEFNLESDLIGPLIRQLGQAEPDDQTLIDKVVEILQFPHAANRITPVVLKQLREAVLNADELGRLEAVIVTKELTCASCSHQFRASEAVSYGTARNNAYFYCRNCWRATQKACRHTGCANVVPIGDLNDHMYCAEHGGEQEREPRGNGIYAGPPLDRVQWEARLEPGDFALPIPPRRRNP